jgi:hypothetical protein
MLDADFFEWLRKEGAFIASIESGLVAEGFRGVIAKTDIDPGLLSALGHNVFGHPLGRSACSVSLWR